MQTIATKLAAVKSSPAAAGWSDNELRSLIHGCGGSPRRAKRMLRNSPDVAKMLAEGYAAAIAEGTHHIHAVKACNSMFLALMGATGTAPAADETDETDEEADEPAPAPVVKAKGKPAKAAKPGVAGLKALAEQAALL